MPHRHVSVSPPDSAAIAASLAELRENLDVSLQFPETVLADAERAVHSPRLPDADETAIPFVTIDPPESMDLDQALHLERNGGGYRVRYAIADVAAFVEPGGPMDVEAHRRGQTLYAPDENARLYPPALSEGAGSLLPGETRPALVWTMQVDAGGEGVDVDVRRALVRSREKLDYAGVQRSLEDGSASEPLRLLREVGLLRQEREQRRGGVDLRIPEQEVTAGPDGYTTRLPGATPRRGLERADLADDRTGGGRADAESTHRPAADAPRGGRRARSRDCGGRRERLGSTGLPSSATPR